LVSRAELWRWSSFRHYAFDETGLVMVNAEYSTEHTLGKAAARR
jgi:hypothetical protein